MKQILCRILVLLVVIAAILGLSSCNIFIEPEVTTYDLVVSNFDREVVYKSELDLRGLSIKATTGDKVKFIPIDDSSLVTITGADTSSVGAKELTIECGGFSWNLSYDVYYKVEYRVDGNIYSSQLVMSRDELFYVKEPTKSGSIFLSWDRELPAELTDNVTINAVFLDGLELPKFTATYGDTLGDLVLPEAKDGHWEWKHDLDTPVGDAGKLNTFTLAFVSDIATEKPIEFDVNVKVEKKKLEIRILEDTFEYDGANHNVKYAIYDGDTVVESGVNIITFGNPQSAIGTYDYTIQVADSNYSADARKGVFSITKIAVTVRVELDKTTIKYGESFPSYRIIVEKNGEEYSFETGIKLGITIPTKLEKGYYDIIPTVKDDNGDAIDDLYKYDITYEKAELEVEGVEFNPGKPQFSTADGTDIFYGDKLSKLVFDPHPNGEWTWDFEYAGGDTVGDAGSNKIFRAKFTPYDHSYNASYAEIAIEVRKKVLNVDLNMNDPSEKTVTVTYDGEAHGIKYVIWDLDENNEKIDLTNSFNVTGNVTYVKANESGYVIKIEIDHPNYTGEDEFKLIIERATPTTNFDTTITVTWSSELTLGSIQLPANYAWLSVDGVAPNSVSINGSGTYTYEAIYTPDDTTNYKTVTGTFTVVVEKADASITGVKDQYDDWTYNGSEQLLANLIKYNLVGNGTVTFLYNGQPITALKNAGTYNIDVVMSATDRYNEYVVSTVVVINKANPQITNLSITNWTYGDQANEPDAKTTYGDIVYRYYTKNGEDYVLYGTDGLTAPENAGTYYVRASVAGGEGYNWNSADSNYREFTVNKKTVNIPEIENLVYTGSLIKPTVPTSDKYYVAEGGNNGGTNVNNNTNRYTVTLTLADSDNYKWDGLTSADAVIYYDIKKAENNVITDFDGGKWTYGDTVSHSTTAVFGDVRYEYYRKNATGEYESLTGKPEDAGEYKVRAYVIQNDNFNGAELTKTFVIEKKALEIPELSDAQSQFVYTSGTIKSGFTAPKDALYTAVDNGGVNVGTYSVVVKLKDSDNYKWDDELEGDERSLEYVITPAKVNITKLTIDNWSYKSNRKNPDVGIDKTFGNATFTYQIFDGEAWVDVEISSESVAGKYRVIATVADDENGNYTGDEEFVEFYIEKADSKINNINSTKKYTTVYNKDTIYTIPSLSGSHTESQLQYAITKNGVVVNEMKNAGEYTVVITLPESSNYKASVETVTVVIEKQSVALPTLSSATRVYNNVTFCPTPSEDERYTSSYENEDSINVGSYKVYFELVDSDNYAWEKAFNEELTYTITKADVTITGATNGANSSASYSKAGYSLNRVVVNGVTISDMVLNPVITKNGEVVNAIHEVGVYTVTYSFVDETGNYNDKTVSYTVTINKASNAFINNPAENKSWTYGNTISESIFNATASFGTVKYRFYSDAEYENEITVTGDTILDFGTYYVQAYVSDNSDNYHDCVSTAVSFNITKANASISGTISGNTDATAPAYGSYAAKTKADLTNSAIVNLAIGTASPVVTIKYTPVGSSESIEVGTIYDAGKYVVTYSYSDNNHNAVSVTVNITIKKAATTFDLASADSKTYDNVAYTLVESVTVNGSVVNIGTSLTRTITKDGVEVSEILNAGTYIITYAYAGDNNYASASHVVTVTVDKAVPVINGPIAAQSSWTYTGSSVSYSATATAGGVAIPESFIRIEYYAKDDNGEYSIINAPSNAGTYYVRALVEAGTNWSAHNSDYVEFKIEKAQVVISNFAIAPHTYNGSFAALPTANTNFGAVEFYFKPANDANAEFTKWTESNAPKNAIEYVVYASVKDDINNNYIGYTTDEVSFTVSKAAAEITVAENAILENSSIVYRTSGYSVNDLFAVSATCGYNIQISNGTTTTTITNAEAGRVVFTDVGTYTIVFTLNDSNYVTDTETVTINVTQFVINTADLKTEQDATYGDSISKLELPSSNLGTWTWDTDETTVGNAGEQTFVAVFTPHDLVNYESLEIPVTVNVAKAGASITASDKTVVYDKDGYVLKDLINPVASHSEPAQFTFKIDGVATEKIYNKNVYTVVIELAATSNYKAATTEVKVTVNAQEFSKEITVYAKYDQTLSEIALPKVEGGELEWLNGTSKVDVVGEHNFLAKYVADNGNYASKNDVTIKVVVSKRDIVKPEYAEDQWFTFDNASHSAVITNRVDEIYYDILNNSNINANETGYTVTIRLKDTVNTQWVGGTTADITFTYKIMKADTSITVNGSGDTFKYGEKEYTIPTATVVLKDGTIVTVTPTVKYVSKTGEVVENYTGAIKNAGVYTITYAYSGNNNHNAAENEEVVVTINKADVTYTGSEITRTYDADGWNVLPEITLNGVNGETIKLSAPANLEITGANEAGYSFTYIFDGTNNYNVNADITVNIVVNRKSITFDKVGNLEYKENENGEAVWQMPVIDTTNKGYSVVTNAGGDVIGKYFVVFQLDDPANCKWVLPENVEAEIDPQDSSKVTVYYSIQHTVNNFLSDNISITNWTYGDAAIKPSIDAKFGTVYIQFFDGEKWVDWTETQYPEAASTYSIRAIVYADDNPENGDTVEGTNYDRIVKEGTLTISAKSASIIIEYETLALDYKGAAYTIEELESLINATITGVIDGDSTVLTYAVKNDATIKNYGTYTVIISYPDSNYDVEEVEVEVTVKAVDARISFGTDTEVVLEGVKYVLNLKYKNAEYTIDDLKALIKANITGVLGDDSADLDYVANTTIQNANGEYKVTIRYANTDNNYNVTSVEVIVKVAKADASISFGEGHSVVTDENGNHTLTLVYNSGTYILKDYIKAAASHSEATVVYSIETVQNANTTGYKLTLSLEASDNYNKAVDVIVTVIVNKKSAEINIKDTIQNNTVTVSYKNGSYELADLIGAMANSGGQSVTGIYYYVNGVKTTSLSAVNETGYAVTVVLENNNYEAASVPVTVVINKADTSITVNGSDEIFNYGEKEYTVLNGTVTLADGTTVTVTPTVKYDPYVGETVENYTKAIKNAGTYTITYTYGGDKNHNAATSVEIVVTIEKTNVSYNGEAINRTYGADGWNVLPTITLSGVNGETLTASAPANATIDGANEAGYNFTYTFAGNNNYNANNEIAVKVVVAKADASISFGTGTEVVLEDGKYVLNLDYKASEYTVDELKALIKETGNHSEKTVSYNIVGTVKDANSYTLTLRLDASANYNKAADVTVTIKVAQADASISFGTDTEVVREDGKYVLNLKYKNAEYTIAELKALIKANITGVLGNDSTDLGYVANTSIKYANGDYKVTISYANNNYNVTSVEVIVKVAKADASISFGEGSNVVTEENGKHTLTLDYKAAEYTVEELKALIKATGNHSEKTVAYNIDRTVKDANSYTLKLTLDESANYNVAADVTVTIKVAQADASISFGTDTEVVREDGKYVLNLKYKNAEYTIAELKALIKANITGVLGNDSTDLGYEANTTIQNANGDYKVTISYANNNYNVTSVEVIVKVAKADASISFGEGSKVVTDENGNHTLTLVYNSGTYILKDYIKAAASHSEATVVYSIETVQNANTTGYELKLSLEASDNYNKADDVTVTVIVNKAKVDIKLDKYTDEFSYNNKNYTIPTGTVTLVGVTEPVTVNGVITAYKNSNGIAANADNLPTVVKAAGTYTITYTYEYANHEIKSATLTVTISKVDVSYNGEAINRTYGADGWNVLPEITLNGVNGETIKLSAPANLEITGANEAGYNFTYTFAGDNNYNANNEIAVKVVVAKADASIGFETDSKVAIEDGKYVLNIKYKNAEYTVDELTALIKATGNHSEKTVAYNIDRTVKDANSYTLKLSFDASDNYNVAADVTVTIKVAQADASIGFETDSKVAIEDGKYVLNIKYKNAEYTIAELKALIKANITGVLGNDSTALDYVANKPIKDANGDYKVTISYANNNYNVAGVEVTVNVAKTTPNITVNGEVVSETNKITLDNRTYGDADWDKMPVVYAIIDGENEELTPDVTITSAITYNITYTYRETDNYNERKVTVTVTVESRKVNIVIPGINADNQVVLGKYKSEGYSLSSSIGAYYENINGEKVTETIRYNDENNIKFTYYNEKGYEVTISLVDDNYEADAKTITVIIEKADTVFKLDNLAVEGYEATKTEKYPDVNQFTIGIVHDLNAQITIKSMKYRVDENSEDGDADEIGVPGIYTIVYYYEGSTNYGSAEFTLKLTVEKSDPVIAGIPENNTKEFDFNDEEYLPPIKVNGVDLSPSSMTYNGEEGYEGAIKNAGEYKLTYTYAGDEYYNGIESFEVVVIIKSLTSNEVEFENPTYTWTYGDDIEYVAKADYGTVEGPVYYRATYGADGKVIKENDEIVYSETPYTLVNGRFEAGHYKVVIAVKDNSVNYNDCEKSIEFVVSRLEVDDLVGALESANSVYGVYSEVTYETIMSAYIKLLGDDTAAPTIDVEYNNNSYTGSIYNAGEYKITYSYDSANYYMKKVEVTIKIEQAIPVITVPVYEGKFYENQVNLSTAYSTAPSAKHPTVASITDIPGTWKYSELKFNGSASTYTLEFIPSNTSYKSVKVVTEWTGEGEKPANVQLSDNLVIDLYTVAMIDKVAYGSIEKALVAAIDTSKTVWVMAIEAVSSDNPITITSDCTIPSGVTLVLPYGLYTGSNGSSIRNTSIKATKSEPTISYLNRVTLVKLAEGKTLTVLGTLEISGILSGSGAGGGYYAGHTSHEYAELMLGTNSRIVIPTGYAGASIKSYGFITEENDNNGSQIILHSGTISQPFTLLDYYGGGILGDYSDKGIAGIQGSDLMGNYGLSPFHEFQFRNVHSQVVIHSGAKFIAWANLCANIPILNKIEQNATEAPLVGGESDSGYYLQLTKDSYLTSKFDKNTGVLDLDIYGGAVANSIKMDLKVAGAIDVELSTVKVYFPIPWCFDISLNPTQGQKDSGETAKYTIKGQVQLLWGSKFVVESGSKLSIVNNGSRDGNLYIHEDWNNTHHRGLPQLYGNETNTSINTGNRFKDALLIVRGELVVDGIAGKVYTDSPNAKITVNKTTSLQLHRTNSVTSQTGIDKVHLVALNTSYLRLGTFKYTECIKDANGNYVKWDGSYLQYSKDEQGNYVLWDGTGDKPTIAYAVKPETYMCYQHTDGNYYPVELCVANGSSGYKLYSAAYNTNTSFQLPTLYNCIKVVVDGKETYVVINDPLLTIQLTIENKNSTKDIVYNGERWAPDKIKVIYNSNGGPSINDMECVINNDYSEYSISLPNPETEGLDFGGWYWDSELTIPVTSILLENINLTEVTFYAKWTSDGHVITFKDIVYIEGKQQDLVGDSYKNLYKHTTKHKDGDNLDLPIQANLWKTESDKQYYFSHYEVNGEKITDYSYFNGKPDGNYIVYAVWIEKHTVTISINASDLESKNCYVTVNNTKYTSSTSFYIADGESIEINVHARGVYSAGFLGIGKKDNRATIIIKNTLGTVTSGNLNPVTEAEGKKNSDITKDITITAASGGCTTITIQKA